MKRPLITVMLLYAGGLLLGEVAQPPLAVLFFISFTLALAAACWSRARVVLLWPLIVCAGWTNLVLHTAIVSPSDLRVIQGEADALVTVQGRLAETPHHRIFMRDEEESWRTLARIEVTALLRDGKWQPAHGQVAASTAEVLPEEFFVGRAVEVGGVIAPPRGPLAEGLFDYRTYLRRQGIYYQLNVRSPADWRVVEKAGPPARPPLSERFTRWARKALALGLPAEDQSLRLQWAMTLGWKTALTDEVSEPFMRSGTLHIFAISGLHIALIAGILVALLRAAQVPRNWCGLAVIPLIWFYTAATGWQPSAIRSTVMMSVILVGWVLNRPSDLLNSLCAAALIILVWEPRQLFQASFQLSFSVVLSLALILPPLEKLRDRWMQSDPFLPAELLPRWQRWLRAPLRWLTTSLALSFAAWLGSLPLTAHYFHLFTPVSLLANVVIVPLSGFALASGIGSLLVGGWFPACAELFNHSGWFWMTCMVEISEWSAGLPGAYRYVASPSPGVFVLYYGLLISISAGWFLRPRLRWLAASLLGATALIVAGQWLSKRDDVRLTVLPLNGGSGVFGESRHASKQLLIDCGDTNSVEFVTRDFLHARGVNRLPGLLLTHGDLRCVGGAGLILDEFNVPGTYTSPVAFRSTAYRAIIEQVDQTPGRRQIIRRGDHVGAWSVLHPEESDRFPQADDNAVVLLGTLHQTRVLFLSDLGRPGQEALLQRHDDLRADIVITGLPTQTEPVCDALLDRVQPQAVIVVDSAFPATRRANPALVERLARRNVPVLYTRGAGAVTITLRPDSWRLTAMNPEPDAEPLNFANPR